MGVDGPSRWVDVSLSVLCIAFVRASPYFVAAWCAADSNNGAVDGK